MKIPPTGVPETEFRASAVAQWKFVCRVRSLWQESVSGGGAAAALPALILEIQHAARELNAEDISGETAVYALRLLDSRGLIFEEMIKLVSLFEELDALAWAGLPATEACTKTLTEALERFCSTASNRSRLRQELDWARPPDSGHWIQFVRKKTAADQTTGS